MEQMQKYRKSMTGAAASIMEAEEYKEMFPWGADGADITFSMLDSYKSRVDSLLDGYLWMTFWQQAINVLLPKRQNKSFSSLLNDDKFIIKQNTNNLPDFFNSYLNIGNVPLP
jgi:hypothetical protein